MRSIKNSPVDCFGARVRATSGSAVGESRRLRQNKILPMMCVDRIYFLIFIILNIIFISGILDGV